MNILVTGGAGYLGSVLTDFVLTQPWVLNKNKHLSSVPDVKIRVIDNLMYKQDGAVPFCSLKYPKDQYEFIFGDVRDTDLLYKHANWADVVIPLAAIVGMPACERDKTGATEINTNHVVNLANKCTNKCIIFPNTNSGYGLGLGTQECTEDTPLTPISTYGKTKCAAEKAVLDCGGIALRLATVFGVSPRMRLDLLVNDFTYKAVTDGYVVLFEKDFKRNYIHIRDVANTFCHMICNYDSCKGNAYNVGLSSANLSKWELCMKIKEQVPGFSVQVDDIRKDPDQRNYIVSNEKLERTGWKPEVTLEDGISELINAYKIIAPIAKKFANV